MTYENLHGKGATRPPRLDVAPGAGQETARPDCSTTGARAELAAALSLAGALGACWAAGAAVEALPGWATLSALVAAALGGAGALAAQVLRDEL